MRTTPRFGTSALAHSTTICCGPAQTGIFTFAGDTTGAPTFHRAAEDS
jgi:hypothetical protein